MGSQSQTLPSNWTELSHNVIKIFKVWILTAKAMAPHSNTLAWKIKPAWWAAVHGVPKSWTRLSNFTFTFHFHALEKEMATHSSVLAWRIPGTADPGGLLSIGSQKVRHDWSDLAAAAAAGPCYGFWFKKVTFKLEPNTIKKKEPRNKLTKYAQVFIEKIAKC